MALPVMRPFMPQQYTKFKVRRPSISIGRYDALPLSALVDLVTLIFDLLTLKLVRIIARGMGNLPTNFGVSGPFPPRLTGQHLSHASRDLATFTLTTDFGGHGACW